MIRQFKRNQLRKIFGNKGDKLKMAWQRFQMKKYKGEEYHKVCRGFKKRGML